MNHETENGGQPTQPQPDPLADYPPGNSRRGLYRTVGIVALSLIVGVLVGQAAAGTRTVTRTRTVTHNVSVPVPGPTITVTVTPPPPPGPAVTMSADGVYVVGKDIRAGTYHTSGPNGSNSAGCYEATLSGLDTTNDIISNNIVNGPDTITTAGAVAIDTEGCNTWTRIGPP